MFRMINVYRDRQDIVYILPFLLICIKIEVAAISCYNCIDIAHPRECAEIKTCAAHEVCFVEGRGNLSGQLSFTSGCGNSATCSVLLGRRNTGLRDERFCNLCCDHDFCNRELCDVADYTHKNMRCLSCRSVQHPSECRRVEECKENQICSILELQSLGYKRYVLGCIDKNHCMTDSVYTTVGKRNDPECSFCCSGDYCNGQLCTREGSGSNQQFLHLHPLQIDANTCHDEDNITCSTLPFIHSELCNAEQFRKLCPVSCGICDIFGWSNWDSWDTCSASCGGGKRHRTRNCFHFQTLTIANVNCAGNETDMEVCNINPCPVDGQWSMWSGWNTCSHSCEGGLQRRIRSCNNPSARHGGINCIGNDQEYQRCNSNPCPVDGQWSEWGPWGACDDTEGCFVYSKRRRLCTNPLPLYNGTSCSGNDEESRTCYVLRCPASYGRRKSFPDDGATAGNLAKTSG